MGYPNIFSSFLAGVGELVIPPACQGIALIDLKALIANTAVFDQTLAAAVADAHNSRVSYVDDQFALSGHELCSFDEWVNGANPGAGTGYPNVAAFHPNEKGQAALAQCLLDAIRQSGNCNGPDPGPPPGRATATGA